MSDVSYISAIQDFRSARRQAALEQALARLTGRRDELLSYEEVRRQVGEHGSVDRGLQEIPLDAIVGSVGRYGDFTRTFLPRSDSLQDRWARVKTIATAMGGWSPIEVYRLGDAYFVLDGNHRVSVARQMGLDTIPAFVTEVRTNVPITPDVDPDQLIIQVQYSRFLARTNLHATRPEADLTVTAPGAYRTLEEHIRVHRHYMGLEQQREIPYEEAVVHWYDTVYEPVAEIIRQKGLLQDFPHRTETDLYLWLAEHRAELEEALGWGISTGAAAEDLASQRSRTRRRMLSRLGERLRDTLRPDELEPGPAPGVWRTGRLSERRDPRLFADIMVAINGTSSGWRALEQALVVAWKEGSPVRGLHVVPTLEGVDEEVIQSLRDQFDWRLGEAHVSGNLVVEAGAVPRKLCDRARWNDLVVAPLNFPPAEEATERLGSGFRQVVHRCPRPLLAVPAHVTQLQHALLAYDGSAKAEEALFVATYMASAWQTSLVVVVVAKDETMLAEVLPRARTYLQEHGIDASFETKSGHESTAILEVADSYGCDAIVMGGYGTRPVVEIVLGSTLNGILRNTEIPVLICR